MGKFFRKLEKLRSYRTSANVSALDGSRTHFFVMPVLRLTLTLGVNGAIEIRIFLPSINASVNVKAVYEHGTSTNLCFTMEMATMEKTLAAEEPIAQK